MLEKSLYLQLADDLKKQIFKGIVVPGTFLPPERELSQKLNVSRCTLRNALNILEEEKFIRRVQGRGTEVLEKKDTGISIGIIIRVDIYRYAATLFEKLKKKLSAMGNEMLIFVPDEQNEPKTIKFIESVKNMVEGFIMGPMGYQAYKHWKEVISFVSKNNKPFVIFHGYPKRAYNVVGANVEKGMAEAMKYLINLGHKRIAFLGITDPRQLKVKAYIKWRKKLGLPEDRSLLVDCVGTKESGYNNVEKILASKPTAFIAHNDDCAIGAMRRLFELGIRIPEDISVSGFDNYEESKYSIPTLSTIFHSEEEAVERAVEILKRNIISFGKRQPENIFVPSSFIPRESTGKAPVS